MLSSLIRPVLEVVLASTCFVLLAYYISPRTPRLNLPPGPPALPLVGNLFQVPTKHVATYFRDLIRAYGGIVSLNLGGMTVILLGDTQLAKLLMERRSRKYSSRHTPLYYKRYIDPHEIHWVFTPPCENNRIGRTLATRLMSPEKIEISERVQEFEALCGAQNILKDNGSTWYHEMLRVTYSTVMTASLGHQLPTGREPEMQEIIDIIDEFPYHYTPPSSVINFIPGLDRLPGPMPWRIRGEKYRSNHAVVFGNLINQALARSELLKGEKIWLSTFASQDNECPNLLPIMITAALDTTSISLHSFVLACARGGDWISSAQREIDNVVGNDRLPQFSDRPRLPFVDAIVREILRWRPAVRHGIPHFSTEDDIVTYRGEEYTIPRGSLIFAVTWHMEHDTEKYADPDEFYPQRFLGPDGRLKDDYQTSAFGFGKRACVGAPFAERTLWINAAMILWTFDIRKATSSTDPHRPVPDYSASDEAFGAEFKNGPFEFPAEFCPRSEKRAELLRRTWLHHDEDVESLFSPRP